MENEIGREDVLILVNQLWGRSEPIFAARTHSVIVRKDELYDKAGDRVYEPASGITWQPIKIPERIVYVSAGKKYVEMGGNIKQNDFIDSVANGSADVLCGIFSEKFAFRVVQQPLGQAGFVSSINGVVTQFCLPNKYGVIGLLAHNYLSGKYFYELEIGNVVRLAYGDRDIKEYWVCNIRSYQALQPTSPNSNFIDLETKEELSAAQLFEREYQGEHHLTLQVCIQKGLEDAWGRYFVIAQPI